MLFNSYEFIFVFLPATLSGFVLLTRFDRHREALAWLFACSLLFFAWWNPPDLIPLLISIVGNFTAGRLLLDGRRVPGRRRFVFALGVAANLALIAYYKYASFLMGNLGAFLGVELAVAPRALPLAISFFTFQQIVFLSDVYRGRTGERDFLRYGLFVSFFPQLIAGPIVHHRQVMPQFRALVDRPATGDAVARGVTVFSIGLFKKVVLADQLASYVGVPFRAAVTCPQWSYQFL